MAQPERRWILPAVLPPQFVWGLITVCMACCSAAVMQFCLFTFDYSARKVALCQLWIVGLMSLYVVFMLGAIVLCGLDVVRRWLGSIRFSLPEAILFCGGASYGTAKHCMVGGDVWTASFMLVAALLTGAVFISLANQLGVVSRPVRMGLSAAFGMLGSGFGGLSVAAVCGAVMLALPLAHVLYNLQSGEVRCLLRRRPLTPRPTPPVLAQAPKTLSLIEWWGELFPEVRMLLLVVLGLLPLAMFCPNEPASLLGTHLLLMVAIALGSLYLPLLYLFCEHLYRKPAAPAAKTKRRPKAIAPPKERLSTS